MVILIYKNIGKRIQKAREEIGISQEELAARLGVSQAALSNYELGKRRLYLANIQQIADVLNKPLSFFMDEPAKEIKTTPHFKNPTMSKIIELLTELPQDEIDQILEYIQWRRDRLK